MSNTSSKSIVGPYQAMFDITNKCNYRCLHCYNASGENNIVDNELSDLEILDLASDIALMKPFNVCICGGEPLLKVDLVKKCSEILYSNGVNHISLVTNGYFLTEEMAKDLYDSHISRIQVSLDGATPSSCFKLRQHKYAFEKAVNALKILMKYNFAEVNIAFTPTRFNVEELEDVCSLCFQLGVRKIRIQPMMIMGRANENINEILPTNEQYIGLLRKIRKINQMHLYDNRIFLDWGDPVDHIIRSLEYNHEFMHVTSVKADGGIMASPYLPITVGNVRNHKLSEYWNRGLPRIWEYDLVKKLGYNIASVPDMGKNHENIPTVWVDEDIKIDIIDDNLRI